MDATLKVYGTEGLRVVDASSNYIMLLVIGTNYLLRTLVIPIGICAHLMAPTYAIAEKAADMIKENSTPNRVPVFSAGLRATSAPGLSGLSIIFALLALLVTGGFSRL